MVAALDTLASRAWDFQLPYIWWLRHIVGVSDNQMAAGVRDWAR